MFFNCIKGKHSTNKLNQNIFNYLKYFCMNFSKRMLRKRKSKIFRSDKDSLACLERFDSRLVINSFLRKKQLVALRRMPKIFFVLSIHDPLLKSLISCIFKYTISLFFKCILCISIFSKVHTLFGGGCVKTHTLLIMKCVKTHTLPFK